MHLFLACTDSEQLTCAGIGKGIRIVRHTTSKAYLASHGPFQVLPGFSDYLLPALVSGHTGCITGTGNIIPKTMVALYNASLKWLETGDKKDLAEAQRLQDIGTLRSHHLCLRHRLTRSFTVSEADWVVVKSGIGGTKYALDSLVEKGLGGAARRPLPQATDAIKKMVDEGLKEAWALEQSL